MAKALPPPTRRGAAAADNGLGQSWPVLFIVALVLGGVLRQVLGRVPGALAVGGVLGVVAWFATLGTLAVGASRGPDRLLRHAAGHRHGRPRRHARARRAPGRWPSAEAADSAGGGGGFGGGGASGRW
jgi:uncharacterized protein